MAAPVEIVVSDLDDSFLARDKSIPALNRQLLTTLYERGIPFVPSTGRSSNGVPQELKNNPAVRYIISSSGAVVDDCVLERTIWSCAVGHERAFALYQKVKDLNVTFDIFCDKGVITETKRFSLVPSLGIDSLQMQLMINTRTTIDMPIDEILPTIERVDRVGIFHANTEEGREARALVIDAVDKDPTLTWTGSHPLGLEITDVNATKGSALMWLCEYLGVNREHAWAFGDSANDVSMLKTAGVGVALANACDEAKQVANHISAYDCDSAGVARELELALANTA